MKIEWQEIVYVKSLEIEVLEIKILLSRKTSLW